MGIGTLTAARLLASIGDIDRFPTPDKLASYTGCAPVPVFSSGHDRQRLNRGGNRQLNSVFYTIALTQHRCYGPAQRFIQTRQATKGKPHAYRALKRHPVRTIYTAMRHDKTTRTHHHTPPLT